MVNYLRIKKQGDWVQIAQIPQNNQLLLSIHKAFAPQLGLLKGSIMLHDGELIEPLFFLKNKINKWSITGTIANQTINLPHLQQYQFESIYLQYIDIFRMMALPINIPSKFIFKNTPTTTNKIPSIQLFPMVQTKEDAQNRIPLKKDGELFQYKHFESSDDIRRIVWKIYAKNQEFIVRTYEREYELANATYMSYSNTLAGKWQLKTAQIALDYYKWSIWNIYQTLNYQNDLHLRHHATGNLLPKDVTSIQSEIINIAWDYTDKNLPTFISKEDSIIVIHSGMTLVFIQNAVQQISNKVVIYFVPLTNALQAKAWKTRLKKLFFYSDSSDEILQTKIAFQNSQAQKNLLAKEVSIIKLLNSIPNKHFIMPKMEA